MSRKDLISKLLALGEDLDYLEELSNTELEMLLEDKTTKVDSYDEDY